MLFCKKSESFNKRTQQKSLNNVQNKKGVSSNSGIQTWFFYILLSFASFLNFFECWRLQMWIYGTLKNSLRSRFFSIFSPLWRVTQLHSTSRTKRCIIYATFCIVLPGNSRMLRHFFLPFCSCVLGWVNFYRHLPSILQYCE